MASPLSSPALPASLESSIEEAVAQLCLPTSAASQDVAPVVASTIRSIHTLLRSSSSSSIFSPSPLSSPSASDSLDGFTSALSSLFQSLLLSRHYEQGLSLLSLLPTSPSSSSASSALVELRFDLLRRLVLGLSQSSSIPLLTSLPFGASLGQVKHVLYQQAQHSDLNLSDPSITSSSSSSPSPPRYYDLLYAVLLAHSDQQLIARSQLHYALRIEAEADLSNPHVLSLYIHSLQRVHNALTLSPDAVVSVRHGPSTSVLSLAHLHRRLQVALAQMDLLSASTRLTHSLVSATPTSLIQPLLDHDLLDRAVSLAAALKPQGERQQALGVIVSHLVQLLSREVTSSERAVFHVEDHRVIAAEADGYFPLSSPSPALHCLRTLLTDFDDSTFHLRSLALSLLLSSPLSLTIPSWLLSHHPIPVAYGVSHAPEFPPPSPPLPNAFVAVLRTLLKGNRLDLAVEVAVRWLEERAEGAEEERGGVRAGKRPKGESGAEWNVLEDLVLRLQQARKISGLDAKTSALVTDLHGTLMKALN